MINVKINGQQYNLLFNGAAMFAIRDKYQTDNISELIDGDSVIAFQRTCKIAVILAEQGELLRRFLGYDNRPMLSEQEILATVTPIGIMRLKNALASAMIEGYSRDVKDENEEIDLGLAELNKKKATT